MRDKIDNAKIHIETLLETRRNWPTLKFDHTDVQNS